MVFRKNWMLMMGLVLAVGCSSATDDNATDDPVDDADDVAVSDATPADLSANFTAAVGALIPAVGSGEDASLSPYFRAVATEGTSSELTSYIDDAQLSEIFGDPDVGSATVSKIRVVLENFQEDIGQITEQDPDFDCTSAEAFPDADSFDVAFYDDVSNGELGDRLYDCIFEETSDEDGQTTTTKVIYGKDSDGILRMISMSSSEGTNEEEPETRGDESRIDQIVDVTYSQDDSGDNPVITIALRYAQATVYNGADGDFDATDDNMVFKSATRITGQVTLEGETTDVAGAVGEFIVTKFDLYPDSESEGYTQVVGRGQFVEDQHSLMRVKSTSVESEEDGHVFCVQHVATDELLALAEMSECSAYEDAYAWGSTTLPFTVLPALTADFESISFYDPDEEADMIAHEGESNFTIPDYE